MSGKIKRLIQHPSGRVTLKEVVKLNTTPSLIYELKKLKPFS